MSVSNAKINDSRVEYSLGICRDSIIMKFKNNIHDYFKNHKGPERPDLSTNYARGVKDIKFLLIKCNATFEPYAPL